MFFLLLVVFACPAMAGQRIDTSQPEWQGWEVTAKQKALLQEVITQQLPLPASAAFSDWSYRPVSDKIFVGVVYVTIRQPSQYGSSHGVSSGNWVFNLRRDGTLKVNGDPTNRSNTAIPFFQICTTGNYQQIKTAIDNGANVCMKDKNGDTALHIAARKNLGPEIIKLVLDSAQSCNLLDGAGQAANIYKRNKGNKESIRILEKYVGDLTAPDEGDSSETDQ
jgi:hypothetical protein